MGWKCASRGTYREGEREQESDLSAMLPQPSFQIRAAPSLENVTFSWSRQGRDGGSGKGWLWGKTNGGGGGREMTADPQKQEGGRMESGRKEAGAEEGGRGRKTGNRVSTR